MSIQYSNAKNGTLNCSINNIFFHSNYNPEKEAERFVNLIECNFIPEQIIISEPALSYIIVFLRKRFPTSKIIAIRYCSFFKKQDNLFDNVIYQLKDIDSFLDDDKFTRTLFLSWNQSEKIFIQEHQVFWKYIKDKLKTCSDILATREYFNFRWLKNSFIFFTNSFQATKINSTSLPILIIASGFSLKDSLEKIKINKNNYFIIALSSSLNPLIDNDIIPDIVISTDGGYWAKKHLEILTKKKLNIPIAVTPESAIPSTLFSTNPIIPLCYNDEISNLFFNLCSVPYNFGKRNGTVAGTAVELALQITSNFVGIIGMDLTTTKGFSHTQPNSLELFNKQKDFYFNNTTTRLFNSELSTGSLDIYASWFKNQNKNFYERLFRIHENKENIRDLSPLQVICFDDFVLKTKNNLFNKNIFNKCETINLKENFKKLFKLISSAEDSIKNNFLSSENKLWFEYCALGDYILFLKYNNEEYKNKLLKKTLDKLKIIKSLIIKKESK